MGNGIKSFGDLKISPLILKALADLGFTSPTAIQEKVIPRINAGHDLIAIAPTGTGKTAAYLIPVLSKLKFPQGDHPRALILVPTRELTLQVEKMAGDLARYMSLRSLAVYGGTGIKNQAAEISKGQDILIATPGRFMDIYLMGELFTKNFNTLVLDEADKMMDMGFLPQLNRILEVIPARKRQNILLSATFPDKVQKLSDDFLKFPQKIEIRPQGSTAESIDQYFYRVPNLKTKINLLEFLLNDHEAFNKVIIFTKTKVTANDVYKFIKRKIDQNVRVIHANKDQNARINAINSFREGDTRILVSTDVTARGIDVDMVSHVINFDVPVIHEEYVHRIGRTGRAMASGESITFVTKPDEHHLLGIEKLIRGKINERKIPAEVEVTPTEAWEKKKMEQEEDLIKRKLDPDFKGAFHRKSPKNRRDRSS
ncbi:MAG: DEAD/DEAH box helicase [Cyclobacteriaceae bacterium]|nr:DEAD/DEAH box helicase [Cyclobacteriaceae bacterium]